MRRRIALILSLVFIGQGFGQVIGDLDWVSPMHEGLAAVKKGNMWGFIDKQGKTVVEPGYVNATNFRNGFALVTQYSKQVLGKNNLLGKDVVNYLAEELIIDTKGEVITSLMNSRTFVPNKVKDSPPEMHAYFVGERLVAVKGDDGQWSIFKF